MSNPRRPPDPPTNALARALTYEQFVELVRAAPPRLRLLIQFLVATGLQSSEALALAWGDLNLENGQLHVRRALCNHQLVPLANQHRNRRLQLSPEGVRALRRHHDHAPHAPSPNDLIFPNRKGGPLDRHHLYQQLNATGRRIGLPWVNLLTLRHTSVASMLQAGEPLSSIQAQLGHHSSAYTLATYKHLLTDHYHPNGALKGAPPRHYPIIDPPIQFTARRKPRQREA